jgi:hypothetical protein
MSEAPSEDWFSVFPSPRIPAVLAYVRETWAWLQDTYPDAVGFEQSEPTLTDNLCEALADPDRRLANRMDCHFQAETWQLWRAADGTVSKPARTDITTILGAPGTPLFVLEFKKLDGSAGARWRYCHDGLNRFVEGTYAVGHRHGAMCAFCSKAPAAEATAMAAYIAVPARAAQLEAIANTDGDIVTNPSLVDPGDATFDTEHNRSTVNPPDPITLLHIFLPCEAAEEEDDEDEAVEGS